MEKCIIVGASFAGIIAARLLKKNNHPFVALEKSKRLGGSSMVGHHRLYEDTSVGFLRGLSEEIAWQRFDEGAQERKKDNWILAATESADECEKFYLGAPYYHPEKPFNDLMSAIKSPIEENFSLEKYVDRIDVFSHKIFCQDGSKFSYQTLIWCADLNALLKSVENNPQPELKNLKKLKDPFSGINVEMELKQSLVPFKNAVIFPFRYKEYRLRAIGMNEPCLKADGHSIVMHWMLFLEKELSEDREEVAKIIRALKRELGKEFPELKELLIKEKIIFKQAVTRDSTVGVKGLELFPDIYYLGPQVRLPDTRDELVNLDLTIENCRRFEEGILAQPLPE